MHEVRTFSHHVGVHEVRTFSHHVGVHEVRTFSRHVGVHEVRTFSRHVGVHEVRTFSRHVGVHEVRTFIRHVGVHEVRTFSRHVGVHEVRPAAVCQLLEDDREAEHVALGRPARWSHRHPEDLRGGPEEGGTQHLLLISPALLPPHVHPPRVRPSQLGVEGTQPEVRHLQHPATVDETRQAAQVTVATQRRRVQVTHALHRITIMIIIIITLDDNVCTT